MTVPDYREEISSQIPAVRLLMALGYRYLTPAEALALRGGRNRAVVLEGVLEPWLRDHNRVVHKGRAVPFTDSALREGVRRLIDVPPGDGLVRVNERVYELLTLGTSLAQTIDGDTRSFSLHYIDWLHPENNVYHVTEEFEVERRKSHQTRRPDVVCFVNGIPLAVIECKRPDLKMAEGGLPYEEAVSQMIRNQRDDEIPHLFAYTQLLLALSVNHAAYAVTGAEKEYWAVWKEEAPEAHAERTLSLINVQLDRAALDRLCAWRDHGGQVRHALEAQSPRLETEQDRTLVSLLDPARLLELSYQYLVFDNGKKKAARYQQYFAVRATLDRVIGLNAQGQRTGGLIWHTTGSGKSLTMVMLAKALSLHPAVSNPRVILVTDRVDLDTQIFDTFHHCGKAIVKASSGRHLIELVQDASVDIIATVINKFETVAGERVTDDNPNIFVLVDESHRSQYGLIHDQMKRVFPRACYIGFTGTPLTKGEKNTAAKFGSFIHKYPMRQAVEDRVVVPLLYEGRLVDLSANREQLDRWFERHTVGLTDEQRADLKRKMSRAEVLNETEQRIAEIAYDLSTHYALNFQGTGFKAQLATSSKAMALRYKKYLDQYKIVTSAVVISPPDTREGHDTLSEANVPEVQAYWKEMMARYGDEATYLREILTDFGRKEGVELLIVVDKLLVGFDQPRNTVLYLDKPLKDHAILQAIARVNRLFEGKDFGYVIDYRGILGELNEAIQTYDALADFDTEDVAGTITDVAAEIAKLPQVHSDLWAVFQGVDARDSEAMERFLEPEDRRQRFYDALTAYTRSLKVALSAVVFYEETPEGRVRRYKNDLKFFHNLRMAVKLRYAEAVDFRDYEHKIRKLLDDHLDAEGVTPLTGQVEIFDREEFDRAVEQLESPRARAEAILNHLKRTAIERMETDPAYYRRFSQLIEDTLQAIREGRMQELEGLSTAEELREQEMSGQRSDLPGQLRQYRDAPAYYGVLREVLDANRVPEDTLAEMAIQVERLIESHKITDWTGNPDIHNRMKDAIDDYLYAFGTDHGVQFSMLELDDIIAQVIDIARKRA